MWSLQLWQHAEKVWMDREYHWWVQVGAAEGGMLNLRAVKQGTKDFKQGRQILWRWFRQQLNRPGLRTTSKLLLWAVVERYRFETMSSHDAVSYYAKMVGLNRKSAGSAIQNLLDENVLWLVLEEEGKRLLKNQCGGRRHYLPVGFGAMIEGVITTPAKRSPTRFK